MSSYEPFLLPLLAGRFRIPRDREVDSPLGEELVIREMDDGSIRIWEELETAVKAAYGLKLVRDIPLSERKTSVPLPCGEGHTGRCLTIERNEQRVFVLEHPAAITVFDACSEPGDTVLLAQPSLYSGMLRESCKKCSDLSTTRPTASPPKALASFIDSILAQGNPSDWHLEPHGPEYRSRLRVNGFLTAGEWLTKERGEWLINMMLVQAGRKQVMVTRSTEGSFRHPVAGGKGVGIRLSVIPSLHGPSLVARFVHPTGASPRSLRTLGLESHQVDRLEHAYKEANGLWLMAGPTGCGKSTTQHALLNLSVEAGEKVLAIEDPVETIHPGIQQLSVGSPPGLTYACALRAFMRQAPDCLLVGEVRDEETAAISLQAARTGHRILATVHARDDAGIIERFRDLGQSQKALSSVCSIVMHQRLVPLVCPDCRTLGETPPAVRRLFRECGFPVPQTTATANGCGACHDGLSGRCGIFSVGRLDPDKPVGWDFLKQAAGLVASLKSPPEGLLPFHAPLRSTHFRFAKGKESVKHPSELNGALAPVP